MTVYVEIDFLVALLKDDWLQSRAEGVLEEHEVVTSPYTYLEILLVREREEFDYVALVANLLDVVPVATEHGHQIVLKAVSYYREGLTPFDAFHAATADTLALPIVSSDRAYEACDPERIPLEPPE